MPMASGSAGAGRAYPFGLKPSVFAASRSLRHAGGASRLLHEPNGVADREASFELRIVTPPTAGSTTRVGNYSAESFYAS